MNNLLTFDEYNVDLTLSEGIHTIDLIRLLMAEEHRLGMDDIDLDSIDEGVSFGHKLPGGKGSDRTVRFVPGKNDADMNNTKMFKTDENGEKKFAYHIQRLEKSGIDSYNLYKFGNIKISKVLKHPEEFKRGDFNDKNDTGERYIDEASIERFMKRSALYIRSIIKKLNFDVDIITYPKSSSEFNELITGYVMDGYRNRGSKIESNVKCIPELLVKDIQTVEVNRERAKELGMSEKEIDTLEMKLNNWKDDYKYIYPLRLELDRMKDVLKSYKEGFAGVKGRRSNFYHECVRQMEVKKQEIELAINGKRTELGRKGKDRTLAKNSRARGFEIKSLDNTTRQAIENLFTINKGLDNANGKSIEERLKGKNVVIFDDNISSGATLDDMCLALKKCGVKNILPITMAIIPVTAYGDYSAKNDFKNRE